MLCTTCKSFREFPASLEIVENLEKEFYFFQLGNLKKMLRIGERSRNVDSPMGESGKSVIFCFMSKSVCTG